MLPNSRTRVASERKTRYDSIRRWPRASTCLRPPLLYVASTSTYPFHVQRPLGWNGGEPLTPDYPTWILEPTDLPPTYHRPHPFLRWKLARGGRRARNERRTRQGGSERRKREGERARDARPFLILFIRGCPWLRGETH